MNRSQRVIIIVINHYTTSVLKDLLRNFLSSLPSHPQIRIDWVISDARDNLEEEREQALVFEREMREEFKNKKRNFLYFFTLENKGFAKNVNRSLSLFKRRFGSKNKVDGLDGSELIFLLNPDTSLYWSNLEKAVKFMNDCPSAEIAGLSLTSPKGQREKWGHSTSFPSLKLFSKGKRFSEPSKLEEPNQVAWVSGGAMLVRLSWWNKLKGLDDGFFLYFEDVDFCKRTEIAGGKVFFLPGIPVGHRRGGAKITIFRRKELYYTSEARFFRIYRPATEYLLLRIFRIPFKIFYFFHAYFRFSFWKEKVKENVVLIRQERSNNYPILKGHLERLRKFRFIKELWIITFFVSLAILGGAIWSQFSLSPPLILHYNAYLGVDFYGNASYFLIFPLLTFLIIFFNFLLGTALFFSKKYAKYTLLLAGASLIFTLLMAMAMINLILVNR